MNGELTFLWLAASVMAVFTAWLVKKGSRIETLYDGSVLLFLLAMMASMFVSSLAYLYDPTITTFFVLVIYNMMIMSAAFIPVGYTLFFGNKPIGQVGEELGYPVKTAVEGAAVVLILVSEVFMGWTFAILSGSIQATGGIVSVFSAVVSSTSSYWFIFTMGGEMAITLLAVRRNLPRGVWWIIVAQAAIMFLSPTAIDNAAWAQYSTYAGSAVMILLFIYVFEFLYKNRTPNTGTMSYLVCIMFAYALMMAGVFVWLLNGDASLFVLSILVEMVVYFYAILAPSRLNSAEKRGWQLRPFWTFGMLSLLFVAEFFMGGVIDVYAYGVSYFSFTGLSLAPVGQSLLAIPAVFYDFIVFFSSVTASPWFLIMMGVEMGALVLFKIREAREFETKVRLGMVVAAYAIYAVFLPYFVIPNSVQFVPWVGWSMGLGTAGAVAPDVLAALVASYLISGVLSFLFGSRNVCSVFCTAALMYQGTAYDSMSSFNRTSKLRRWFLTSKFSSVYKSAASLVWLSLIVAAVLSYLTSVGVLNVSFFGSDVSFFVYTFYFSFLWYIIWIMIPFVGTYGCVNTGMCGWGSFNQLVSRFGFFRLKVKDRAVCVSCKTVDCSKVCPVGITDLPKAFITKGELRSMKCIGVGDCVTACPYENISFFDVRHWIRAKIGKPTPLAGSRPLGLKSS